MGAIHQSSDAMFDIKCLWIACANAHPWCQISVCIMAPRYPCTVPLLHPPSTFARRLHCSRLPFRQLFHNMIQETHRYGGRSVLSSIKFLFLRKSLSQNMEKKNMAALHHFCYSIVYSCVPSRKRRNPTRFASLSPPQLCESSLSTKHK
ncbi:hypothetical protein OPV22_023673 [Ensete ventricosum]|uniref:Uncharacterized protein n=1 Tax=Ensete ventricosum TaxID=4639 RepID=A0AAV8PD15_ENSVE|nr:hypothetical protein OPV22_023673 [Ensete ventricosum]